MAKGKKRSSTKKYQLQDDKNFILIAGGGFLVIVLMFMVTGNMGLLNRVNKSEASAEVRVEKFVTIESNGVTPKLMHVLQGTTVTWINKDLALHTIEADNGAFNTGNLHQGESGSIAFDTPGTFEYKDQYNPEITGTIVVE